MAVEIRVPPLSEAIGEATVGRWIKKEGDSVALNEIVVELETDEFILELPAPADGTLGKIRKREGETVRVNELLAWMQPADGASPATAAGETATARSQEMAPAKQHAAAGGGPAGAQTWTAARVPVAEHGLGFPDARGVGRGKRIWGIVILVLAAFLLIGFVQDPDLAGALIVALFASGGGLLYRAGKADGEHARSAALGQMQIPVLALAREDGRLTVTEVASRLGWTLPQARAVLDSLDDGLRVWSTPSDEGVMVYEFRELIHDPDRPRLEPRAEPRLQPPPGPSS
jgi:hypothetical protein